MRGLFGRLFGAGRAAAEAPEPSPLVELARRLEETEKRPLLRIPTEDLADDARRVADLLNARLDALASAEKEQQQFIADVSHELRTPLTVLRGSLEVALEEERPAEEYREAIGNAILEVRHLTRISQNLLFLTRGESGRVTLSFANLDARPVRRRGRERPRRSPRPTADCELTAEIPSPSGLRVRRLGPAAAGPPQPDRERLRYTEPGGKIHVSVAAAPGEARISVADTGVGIPEADLPFVFERFFRTKRSRAANPGGSGLGLSIVRWIVEAHKGQRQRGERGGEGIDVHGAPAGDLSRGAPRHPERQRGIPCSTRDGGDEVRDPSSRRSSG